MKYIKLNKLLILLALSFILVGCNKDNAETNKETISESENEIQESNKETETVKEDDKEKTENNDISKTILTNLSKLFEKFNPNVDYTSSTMEIIERLDSEEDDESLFFDYNSLEITPSYLGDNKYDVIYKNIIENNEASFEDIADKFGGLLKDNYDIDQKDFHDKIMSEFKNGNSTANMFTYTINENSLSPVSFQWMAKSNGDLSTNAHIPSVESNSEAKNTIFEISYNYLNNPKSLINKDKDLTYNLYQLSNNTTDYTENLPDFSNMTQEDISKAVEDALSDINKDPEEMENNLKENLNLRSAFYVRKLNEVELNENQLDPKNKDEIYEVKITVDGSYDLELEKFTDELDKLSVNFPDEIKAKLPEIKDAMKKQHTEKSLAHNSIIDKNFKFDAIDNALADNEMLTELKIFVDKDGNIFEIQAVENTNPANETN